MAGILTLHQDNRHATISAPEFYLMTDWQSAEEDLDTKGSHNPKKQYIWNKPGLGNPETPILSPEHEKLAEIRGIVTLGLVYGSRIIQPKTHLFELHMRFMR